MWDKKNDFYQFPKKFGKLSWRFVPSDSEPSYFIAPTRLISVISKFPS